MVIDLIEPSRINSKQQILDTLKSINNKGKLDQYLANSLLKFEKLGLSEELEEDNAVPEDSTDMAIDMMKNGLPRESVKENKMTARDKYLTKLVKEALDLEGHGDDNVYHKLEKRGDQPAQQAPTYSEGEEVVQDTTIPEYKTVEELMTQIDKGTNKVAEEHKIAEMKRIAKLLREKAQNLEESEHAAHINPKDIKKLNDEAIKLDKAAAKFQAAYEKTYNRKGKGATAPKVEKEEPATLAENKQAMENTFDLKKFLVENKLTTNSRMLSEGFLDNVAASIKGKSEQGKLAQEVLNKVGITKNPAEIFSTGIEGGGAGPFENEVQDYIQNGGDVNTKIPFSQNMKSSAGGAIFKETYTFDFSKDIPTVKSGGKYIWNIKGGKWEPFGDKDGNENMEEPLDIEAMKKESDAEPGAYATEAVMMTIADAAKAWPGGYGERLRDIIAEKQ